ncbi:hypothetical protein [Hymenobacter jeollabukensis]|uniref:Uncharacterized protein n=1 Tax=Hymenobacter jeollabukensis TaxID=2025313 RepID=A0A5R8WJP4_9BACT|nr:hypothetical protein [Hymenobacter jeollabukensis]TLM88714.1 hypothetical protein FDY95_23040 [Hymenobacter jeollabukensis]
MQRITELTPTHDNYAQDLADRVYARMAHELGLNPSMVATMLDQARTELAAALALGSPEHIEQGQDLLTRLAGVQELPQQLQLLAQAYELARTCYAQAAIVRPAYVPYQAEQARLLAHAQTAQRVAMLLVA